MFGRRVAAGRRVGPPPHAHPSVAGVDDLELQVRGIAARGPEGEPVDRAEVSPDRPGRSALVQNLVEIVVDEGEFLP